MLARLITYSSGSRFVLAVSLAALLALCLVASPAFAQAEAGDANLLIVDCSQVQTALAQQYNSGDAVAVSQGQYGDAIAVIAQELDISQSQVNGCLGGGANGTTPPDTTPPDDTASETPTADTTTAPDGNAGAVDNPKGVIASTIADGELVNTGGIPLPVVAAGLLLAGGLMSAGAIIRRGR
ncbi:MAG TPA: hypothetical protein VJ827_08490 [Rubrobacter sp.]|nr:hypothetical protein [Rubrobacter sp.]